MKLKLYISTYNNRNRISKTLANLAKCRNMNMVDVFVVNNHSNFSIDGGEYPEFERIDNNLRPDFSTGHLSRTWNQCIINGFKSLTNPDCDYVITAQDDSLFKHDWVSRLLEVHEEYEFVQNGHGDHVCSYSPEHIRKVGLWDERFCGISRQAADYFVRCLMYNKEKSTINDIGHSRVNNPIFKNEPIHISQNYLVESNSRGVFGDAQYPNMTDNNDSISINLIFDKYGIDPFPWSPEKLNQLPEHTLCKNYILYPYFEKDIYNLKEKNYLL